MKGLELAKAYYLKVGRPSLEAHFPELLPRIAAGLAGEGSECFGYDDAISQDHDYGPGFCLWLDEADHRIYGAQLQAWYDSLPGEFLGYPARIPEKTAGKRVGVLSVQAFYRYFIGDEIPPQSERRWLYLNEESLACAVNGAVFEDNPGVFSSVRSALLQYYPNSIRVRRIVMCTSRLSQSGQYNYGRCMRRGEYVAAEQAKAEFIRCALQLMHLLNRRYAPYYKWIFRSASELPRLSRLTGQLEQLAMLPIAPEVWTSPADPYVNRKDPRVVLIEDICAGLLDELKEQGLTEGADPFLQNHLDRIASHMDRII